MKSATQPASIDSINHQETATPVIDFLLPPQRLSHCRFFWGVETKRFFFRAEAEGKWADLLYVQQVLSFVGLLVCASSIIICRVAAHTNLYVQQVFVCAASIIICWYKFTDANACDLPVDERSDDDEEEEEE